MNTSCANTCIAMQDAAPPANTNLPPAARLSGLIRKSCRTFGRDCRGVRPCLPILEGDAVSNTADRHGVRSAARSDARLPGRSRVGHPPAFFGLLAAKRTEAGPEICWD